MCKEVVLERIIQAGKKGIALKQLSFDLHLNWNEVAEIVACLRRDATLGVIVSLRKPVGGVWYRMKPRSILFGNGDLIQLEVTERRR